MGSQPKPATGIRTGLEDNSTWPNLALVPQDATDDADGSSSDAKVGCAMGHCPIQKVQYLKHLEALSIVFFVWLKESSGIFIPIFLEQFKALAMMWRLVDSSVAGISEEAEFQANTFALHGSLQTFWIFNYLHTRKANKVA